MLGGGGLPLWREAVGVFYNPPPPADWAEEEKIAMRVGGWYYWEPLFWISQMGDEKYPAAHRKIVSNPRLSLFFPQCEGSRKEISKVGDRSREWPEGSLFNSYYTKV